MREDTKTIIFAAITCITCSLLLSGTAAGLKSRQKANQAFDVQRNIVKAFGINIGELTNEEISEAFEKQVTEFVIDTDEGTIIDGLRADQITSEELAEKTKMPVYTWTEDGDITKYAFPVSGKGLWSMLYGYLSIESDLETIAGISFYKHGETPGLGAEIEKAWFLDQFPGKKLYNDGAPLPFLITKGNSDALPAAEKQCAVDGISGATLTSKGVQILINNDAAIYSTYFNQIKGN